ncbi:MAG: hypothetical protein AAF234_11460 [Pseudomonadota bacterium]
MAFFRKHHEAAHDPSEVQTPPNGNNASCACQQPHCVNTANQTNHNLIAAQIELADAGKISIFNVYDHDLLTFDIRAKDIPLLNALAFDLELSTPSGKSFETASELYIRLKDTHPYSSRHVDEQTLRRWIDLCRHVLHR